MAFQRYRAMVTIVAALPLIGCVAALDPVPPPVAILSVEQSNAAIAKGGFGNLPTTEATALAGAIVQAEASRGEWLKQRKDRVSDDTNVGTLVLLGALATTASAVFGAPTDLIAALALGTSATQTSRSLFFQRGYPLSYRSGAKAVGCVVGAGRLALDGHLQADETRALLVEQETAAAPWLAAANADVIKAVGKAMDSRAKADSIRIKTASLARRIPVSVAMIEEAMVDQLDRQMPDAQAYSAAFQALASFTAPGKAAPVKPPTGPAAAVAAGMAPQPPQIIAAIDRLAAAMDAADQLFQLQASALTACGFVQVAAAAPLSLSGIEGNAVELKKGDSVRFEITGGSAQYFTAFVGALPSGLSLSALGSSVTLAVTTDKPQAGKYMLRIRDAAAGGSSIDVTVTIKADAPPAPPPAPAGT